MSDDVVEIMSTPLGRVLPGMHERGHAGIARSQIAALHAVGWRVVPYEPTEAMEAAAVSRDQWPSPKAMYQAMLDSSDEALAKSDAQDTDT